MIYNYIYIYNIYVFFTNHICLYIYICKIRLYIYVYTAYVLIRSVVLFLLMDPCQILWEKICLPIGLRPERPEMTLNSSMVIKRSRSSNSKIPYFSTIPSNVNLILLKAIVSKKFRSISSLARRWCWRFEDRSKAGAAKDWWILFQGFLSRFTLQN